MKTYAFGSEINDFYNNHLPDGYNYDDMSPFILDNNNYWTKDDKLSLISTEKYNLDDLGVVVRKSDGVCWDFSEKFLEWQDKQRFDTFIVKTPKNMTVVVKGRIVAIDPMIEILESN